ncbi:MAG: hypothetical protein K6E62_05645 [Lachnospiraceae bacterium]|nr:hypothetical protein [Lachnospiraceae bacterium]
MVDLAFVSLFFGPIGVTVIGYVGPLITLYELVGTGISSGARNRVSSLIGAGRLEEANQVYSSSVILGTGISMLLTVLTLVFCNGVCQILGARGPAVHEMTMQYLYGYVIGIPFFSLTRILKLYLEMSGLYANRGFADEKEHRVNVRLVAKDEDLMIRMRDDFESVNITDIYKKDMEEKEARKIRDWR